jgi:uncharacterized protein YjbI with pentapeptide repeats
VDLSGVTFASEVSFAKAEFDGDAVFGDAVFQQHADFDDVTFGAAARFTRAIFEDHAGFQNARFRGHARFDIARFRSYADFEHAVFSGDANLAGATFQLARRIGPMLVHENLVLDESVFDERVHIDVAARGVSAHQTVFADGAHMRVRWAEIALDGADFARSSTLTGAVGSWPNALDLSDHHTSDARQAPLTPRPRLLTLRGAQVGALALSNIDLSTCRFFGAHDLHSLRIDSSCIWPRTPTGGFLRYRDRETLAEEQHWREWTDPESEAPEWLLEREGDPGLEPMQIAGLYRALRNALEDTRDQAGAGDLYFGEMDMRRRARPTCNRNQLRAQCDRGVLFGYWLLSAYGLKATRALAALAIVILTASCAMRAWGIAPPPTISQAIIYSAQSTSSLFRSATTPPHTHVTETGEVIETVLRIVGPILIALALLALRGRVKR